MTTYPCFGRLVRPAVRGRVAVRVKVISERGRFYVIEALERTRIAYPDRFVEAGKRAYVSRYAVELEPQVTPDHRLPPGDRE